MGQRFAFKCADCGYDAEVGGGREAGMRALYATIECLECKALYDVFAGEHSFPAGGANAGEPPLLCPKNKAHEVREWVTGDACPKCGGVVEQGDVLVLWD